jgi:hypothetical protein
VWEIRATGRKARVKEPLRRPRLRRVNNIKMELVEIDLGCLYWICVARDRDRWRALLNEAMNFRVP